VAWIDRVIQGRRRKRELVLLQKIEERGLCAQGVNLVTARRKAQRAAEAMVTAAAEARSAPKGEVALNVGQAVRDAATRPEAVLGEREFGLLDDRRGRLERWLGPVLGPRARFVAGAVLLTGCLGWVHQNGIITKEHLEQAKEMAGHLKDVED